MYTSLLNFYLSYVRSYILTDLPGAITGINVSPDTITACSFVVQWSEPSSDPFCGTVWYIVTISTEGGTLNITDNTTMTNYSVTGGLNNNTVYHVNVTASNNAGSSDPTGTSVITNSIGKFVAMHLATIAYVMYNTKLCCNYLFVWL